MYENIIVASDGSSLSMRAAVAAAAIARALSAKLTVVTVAYFPKVYEGDVGSEMREGYTEEWKRVLKETLGQAGADGVQPEGRLLEGEPAAALLDEVERGKYDLLVVGRTGAGSPRSRMMGGTSRKIVENATCSVLVVR
jgi:nucleotide-binding universal stress UspA family protein